MALALLFQDSSVLYMDAVRNYSKTRSSNISRHPVDKSSVITDHISKNNPKFTVRGIVSSADFHSTEYRSQEVLNSSEYSIDTDYNQPVQEASVTSGSGFLDFLPGSIQHFLGQKLLSSVNTDFFRGYSHQAARDKIQSAWENSELLTLLDYDTDFTLGRSVSVRSFEDLIIERYEDNESPDTGDSLEFTLTFEKIRYAYIKEIDVQINNQPASTGVNEDVPDQAASEDTKGDQSKAEGEDSDYFADYVESSEGLGWKDARDIIPGL